MLELLTRHVVVKMWPRLVDLVAYQLVLELAPPTCWVG